jgi:regulator of sigma E protease
VVNSIQGSGGKELSLTIGSKNGRRDLTVIPRVIEVKDGKETREIGQVGIEVKREYGYRRFSLGAAAVEGFRETVQSSTLIFRSIRGMLRGLVSPRTLGGPIAIGQMAGQSLQVGWDTFLNFMAYISISLAVLNLLPIPVLDGGQFLFLLAEAVIRRPLSLRLRERLTAVGLVMILLLMVFAFSNDILKLFGI